MCSKSKKSVDRIVLSDRTKIYADNPEELAVKLAGRFKGSPAEFDALLEEPIKKLELVQSRDKKGLYYESKPARTRRLAESSRSSAAPRITLRPLAVAQ
jgi:hypothetical protein